MSNKELADYCGVPLNTVRTWRHRNVGPRGYKVGRHVRYRLSDVEAWILSDGATSEAQPA